MMSFVSNLFFTALLLQLTQCANITLHPVSINTTLNSTVVFSCEAAVANHSTDDHGLTFRVNNMLASNTRFMEEFSETTTCTDDTMRAELEAKAYEYNNNTEVKCRASAGKVIIFSNTAVLMIQGLLDNVGDIVHTFINGSSVLLTWTAPYTLDNVPITGYYILNGLVNITTTNNNTNITLSTTNPDPCILNDVSVSPINDVGIGSSNDISFYYETVPLITPPVSVVPVIDGEQISLNISINVSMMCNGEYPNSITVDIILNTDNTVKTNNSISTQVDDQLIITGVITVPNNLSAFIVNVSLSNNGGEFFFTPSFGFGFLGPVTNIDSSIDNCSTIDITWTAPTVDDRVSIQYHILRIHDAITGSLVDTVSVYDTSHQFVDNNLFIHRYTYVITGANELGEGISNNDTFSYQRVPRSVTRAHLRITTFNETSVNVSFSIPVIIECTGEAPENASITIQCNETGVVYDDNELVEYLQPRNITGSVPMLQNQQCNISIVFSNEAGSSEPFILAFDTTPPIDPTPSPTGTDPTPLPTGTDPTPLPTGTDETATSPPIISTSDLYIEIGVIGSAIAVVLVLIGLLIIIIVVMYYRKVENKKPEKRAFESSTHASVSIGMKEGNEHQHQHTNARATAPTGGVATKEPIYLDLEASKVQYVNIESTNNHIFDLETEPFKYGQVKKNEHKGLNGDNEIGDGTTSSKTETDDVAPMSHDTAPVEATTPEGSEVIVKQLNKKQHQEATKSVAATTGGAIVYSDLGIVPTEAVSQDQSVQYASTVFGATGGDTIPPPQN